MLGRADGGKRAKAWTATAVLMATFGCAGDSSDPTSKPEDGGVTTDGEGGNGASGGATGGTGGTGAAGGGAGGASGMGAAPPTPCLAPSDPTTSAICVEIEPEPIEAEADTGLDGLGVLVVQVFDRPRPGLPDGGTVPPLAEVSLGGTTPVDVRSVLEPIRFEDLPATVYVRASFFDGPTSQRFPAPGTWIGGIDLSQGLAEDLPLSAVNLDVGAGRTVTVPLTALRRLTVRASLASGTTALDDAQGPASFFVVSDRTLGPQQTVFGIGVANCLDLSAGQTQNIEGVFVGTGPYFVFVELDDYRLGTKGPSVGSLVTIEVDGGGQMLIPDANRIEPPAEAYQHGVDIELNGVIGLGDAGAPASHSCNPSDAGQADAMGDGPQQDAPSDAPIDAAVDATDASSDAATE